MFLKAGLSSVILTFKLQRRRARRRNMARVSIFTACKSACDIWYSPRNGVEKTLNIPAPWSTFPKQDLFLVSEQKSLVSYLRDHQLTRVLFLATSMKPISNLNSCSIYAQKSVPESARAQKGLEA